MATSTPPESPRWVMLEAGVGYDPGSVRVNGSLRQVWVQIELPSPDRTPESIGRIRVLYEIDCRRRRFRTLSVEMVAAAGDRTIRQDATGPWTRITPDHGIEALLRTTVCALAT